MTEEIKQPTPPLYPPGSRGRAQENSASSVDSTVPGRFEVVEQMVRDAGTASSPVAAVLQVNGADLMEISLHLKPSIVEAIKGCKSVQELKDIQPCIDSYVKVCRQADRVLRLQQEIVQQQRNDGNGSDNARSQKRIS